MTLEIALLLACVVTLVFTLIISIAVMLLYALLGEVLRAWCCFRFQSWR